MGARASAALDLHLRAGAGLSDRFVLSGDLCTDLRLFSGADRNAWSLTANAQFYFSGDHGLSVNAGAGIGGLSKTSGFYTLEAGSFGAVIQGGVAYDFHISQPRFVLSPELFASWHAADHTSAAGVRLNLLGYLQNGH